jgi:hypothetical protein
MHTNIKETYIRQTKKKRKKNEDKLKREKPIRIFQQNQHIDRNYTKFYPIEEINRAAYLYLFNDCRIGGTVVKTGCCDVDIPGR